MAVDEGAQTGLKTTYEVLICELNLKECLQVVQVEKL